MIGGASVPRWVAHVLDGIDACASAELAGFVLDGEPRRRARAIERLWTSRSHVLFALYSRLDARRFATAIDPLGPIDVSARLRRHPVLKVRATASEQDERRFDVDAIATIESWDLDVMLKFSRGVLRGAILDCARHGVWAYHHGDPDAYRGDPPLFWEIFDGAPVSGTVLQRLTEDPAAHQPIYTSFSATDPISLRRSRTQVYWKSAEFVGRKLRDIHRDGGVSDLKQHVRPGAKAQVHGTPTNRQMLRFGWRLADRLARRKTRQLLARQQWFIAYRRHRAEPPSAERFRGATFLVPPSDRFYADPCLVDWKGRSFLFFEEFRFAERKGVVAYCQLTPDGRCTRPQTVLERPYHLSYPFVFVVGDDAYMLPETAANRAIELYRARSFPGDWAREAILVSDVRAVDPTLIERDGHYWLFANVAVEGASKNDELCLFSARDLRGPWEPHPRNPVVSDVRRARPGGRPFTDERGDLIRPSQDCSGFYGSAVVFNRIDELSETEYRETPVGRLEPHWHPYNLGTHTYTRTQMWEALDARTWVRKGLLDQPHRPAADQEVLAVQAL
jgi:hypothetical protein